MALNEPDVDRSERDSRLDQLYPQIGLEEPRPELDAAIRAAARREAGARPRAFGTQLRRWQLPISIAAVVVISASMVILMREEGVDRFEATLAPKAAEDKAVVVTQRDDADFKAKAGDDAPARAQAPAPRASTTPPAGLAQPLAEEAPARTARARSGGRIAPAEPFPGEMRERSADAANEPAAPASALAKKAPGRVPEPPAAPLARTPSQGAKSEVAETERQAPGKRAPLATSERLLTDDRISALINELKAAGPKEWLEEIETLRRQRRNDEADRLLAEFRRRFPDYPVPEREGGHGN